jgi:hypothetical protein
MRKLALVFTGIMARRRLVVLLAGCGTATTTTAGCVLPPPPRDGMYGTVVDKRVDR